jgi:putative DNA primase/helicase
VAADWQDEFLPRLDTVCGREAIEPFVEPADLIIIDNRSSLFDPEAEKDPTAWQPAQNWLLSLRRRRKAVLLAHHTNRAGGARGHSKPEDVMDLLLKLSRPEGYSADEGARFTLEFDKVRGVHGAALMPFTAKLDEHGWQLEDGGKGVVGKLREYLHLAHKAGDRPKSANAAIAAAKVGRNAGLAAWADLRQNGELREHVDGGFYLA